MTFENRLPANYAFGTLTGAAAISDTTLTSTDFATYLPSSLSTTNYVPMVLQDPATHNFEIVWVSAHTAAASTCTVVRGKEATSARAWGTGTLWVIAPTLRDGVLWVTTRANLPTDPHVGLRCFVQDEQIIMTRDLVGWTFAPNDMVAQKTGDESVTSSTTLQNDDHIFFSVAANAMYRFEGFISYLSIASPAGGLKIDWTLPAGATMEWSGYGVLHGGTLVDYDVIVQNASTARAYGGNGGFQMSLQPKGWIKTVGTAGTAQMRWAQQVSNATATTLKYGSYIRLARIS